MFGAVGGEPEVALDGVDVDPVVVGQAVARDADVLRVVVLLDEVFTRTLLE
ncbi:hypothetical protein AB0425_23915 [Actinosynnema sp. NPDC051121]